MILLQLKLVPSAVAGKYVFFQVLRSCSFVSLLLAGFLLPFFLGVVVLVIYVVLTVVYYYYLYKLVLCIFTLAGSSRAEGEGQPVGRHPVPPPADVTSGSDLLIL